VNLGEQQFPDVQLGRQYLHDVAAQTLCRTESLAGLP
jgi:hypothetical protein